MSNIKTDDQTVTNFLERAVENAYPNKEAFAQALKSGKQLTAYLGIDPTGPSLHLGHAIAMRKLKELQDMGHRCILLIGDFTAMIGDPTDKTAARKQLTREQVLENCKNYRDQASKILDMDGKATGNPIEMKYNSEWLGKMSFAEVLELASHFTVQQMLERDMFRRRMSWRSICPECHHENLVSAEVQQTVTDENGKKVVLSSIDNLTWKCKECAHEYTTEMADQIHSPRPIFIHEFLYPLMQGYDSVAMDVDIEVGGNDQTFNMLAGRELMKDLKGKEKFVVACKLLADPDGKKMGKSEGNMITLNDAPEDMFGKVMSWPDGVILDGLEICTNMPGEEIDEISTRLDEGVNPVGFKRRLAREIVSTWHSIDDANRAEEHFDRLFKDHQAPEEMPEFEVSERRNKVVDLLVLAKLVPSKTEARRQIEQGAVKVDGQSVSDTEAEVEIVDHQLVLQKGKRGFARIKLKS
ncbi:MAG: tyrosine--tRNA ligase [Patescibacteria group bacterium]|jgi:tyrosyl-tRNA synthetase